jgi:ABC-type glycerol-3-phosphate transport system permease component
MKLSINRKLFVRFIAYIIFSIIGFIYLYPFLWMVASSLKTTGDFFGSGLSLVPQQPRWENYLEAWWSARFSLYFGNTVFIAVIATTLTVLFTSMAGFTISRYEFLGKKILISIMLVTVFLPRGYTIIPIFEVIKNLKLLNSLWAVILVSVGTSMVFNTFLFIGYFNTLPKDIEESAILDGANFPMIYWHIAMPYALPMIGTVALFEIIDNWNSFFIPLVFTLGRPELRTLAVGMYAFMGENSTDWTLLCAAATISLFPIVILFLLLQRTFINGIVGAIKG